MNFLQVTIARILVKVSPGKIQNTRDTDLVDQICYNSTFQVDQ